MKWKPAKTARANAKKLLPKLVDEYFESGRKAVEGKKSPKALHRFRLITKKFRYSLELFRPIYGPSLDRRLETLRELQNVLGKVSDYAAIRKLLIDDHALAAKARRALHRTSDEFRERWQSFDRTGQLRDWKLYLARAGASAERKKHRPKPSP